VHKNHNTTMSLHSKGGSVINENDVTVIIFNMFTITFTVSIISLTVIKNKLFAKSDSSNILYQHI